MKKKISLKEWTKIGRYNYAAKWCRPLCSYYLIKKDDKTFERVQTINIFNYILVFIPVHLFQALVLLWDGGLKEFIIFNRSLGYDLLTKGSESYARAEQIWNKSSEMKSDN
jgi:hypothetical protein